MESKEVMSNWNNKLLAVLFILAPLASNFVFVSHISFGDVFIVGLVLMQLSQIEGMSRTAWVGVISTLLLIGGVISGYLAFYPESISSMLRLAFYLIASLYLMDKVNTQADEMLEAYLNISILFSALLLVQVIVYHMFGIVYVYFNSNIEIEKNALLLLDLTQQDFRTGGVFREPSYFAIFTLPALVLFAKTRQRIWWIFSATATVLSTSVLGFCFVILSSMYLVRAKPVIVIIGMFSVSIFIMGASLDFLPSRVQDTLAGDGSFLMRVYMPFEEVFTSGIRVIYPNYDLLERLSDPDTPLWFNSFCYLVIIFGIFSLIPMALIMASVTYESALYLAILLFSTNALSSPYFIFVGVLLVSISRVLRASVTQ